MSDFVTRAMAREHRRFEDEMTAPDASALPASAEQLRYLMSAEVEWTDEQKYALLDRLAALEKVAAAARQYAVVHLSGSHVEHPDDDGCFRQLEDAVRALAESESPPASQGVTE